MLYLFITCWGEQQRLSDTMDSLYTVILRWGSQELQGGELCHLEKRSYNLIRIQC